MRLCSDSVLTCNLRDMTTLFVLWFCLNVCGSLNDSSLCLGHYLDFLGGFLLKKEKKEKNTKEELCFERKSNLKFGICCGDSHLCWLEVLSPPFINFLEELAFSDLAKESSFSVFAILVMLICCIIVFVGPLKKIKI